MTDGTLRRRGISRRRGPRGSPRRQRGAVTAEIAAGLPALVLVTVVAIWGIAIGLAQLRCADAAREAVRAAARGDDPAVVQQVAEATAPVGATIVVTERDGLMVVEVTADIAAPLLFADRFLAPRVTATALAVEERR
jgi:hypothetical protein